MKKFITLIICLQLINFPAFAGELMNDNLVDKTLQDKNLSINKPQQKIIEDSFAENTLKNIKNNESKIVIPINDTFADKTLQNTQLIKPSLNPIEDKLAEKTLKNCTSLVVKKNNFDFDLGKRIPVKISIINSITTKQGLKEGQEISFKVLNDVKIGNNVKISKDSLINARLETISLNQSFGVPADILIDDFKVVSNQKEINLDGSIHKIGANRSLWVYPIGYMGCFFFGAGVLLFPIRGGHAKLKTTDVFEVYYIPNLR